MGLREKGVLRSGAALQARHPYGMLYGQRVIAADACAGVVWSWEAGERLEAGV